MLDSTSPASLISTHTPLARRDGNFGQPAEMYGFLLTRLLRGVTRRLNFLLLLENISTHTPLARRDVCVFVSEYPGENFYSHASCEA